MVLRTILLLRYKGRDTTHTYISELVQLLLILDIDRDVVVRSCLQELVILLLGVLVLLKVVVVAQEGSSSLNIDAFIVLLHVTNLILLGRDSGLK